MTDDNLVKFINDYDLMMNHLMDKYKFNIKLRITLIKFKKYLIKNEYCCDLPCNSNEYFSATASFTIDNIGLMVSCPIDINISKMLSKDLSKYIAKIKTSDLFNIIPVSTKANYDEKINCGSTKDLPILLKKDDIFDYQIIDGNHRVIRNYLNGKEYTNVYFINSKEIIDCLDNEIYKRIIFLFKDILNSIK